MKITVTIDLEDHPTKVGSRLGYDYAIDPLHEIDLRVPSEPPVGSDPFGLMRWQERRTKAKAVRGMIASCISEALGNAMETDRDGR